MNGILLNTNSMKIIQRIVEHEMGHALGLGHANFDGNLMAEKVNDGTEKSLNVKLGQY